MVFGEVINKCVISKCLVSRVIKARDNFSSTVCISSRCNKTFAYAWLSFPSGFDVCELQLRRVRLKFHQKRKKKYKTNKQRRKWGAIKELHSIFTVTYLFAFSIENLLNPQVTLLAQLSKNLTSCGCTFKRPYKTLISI